MSDMLTSLKTKENASRAGQFTGGAFHGDEVAGKIEKKVFAPAKSVTCPLV